jgi:hypothetical protein
MTNDQISFQLASIEEVIAAKSYLEKNRVPVLRMGRDFPAKPGPFSEWPERVEAPSDVYADQPLMGPLG